MSLGSSARVARAATLVAVAAVYFAAGKAGLSLAVAHASASAVWPPTGIALASLLLLGRGVWPAIFAGAFLVNATTAGNVGTSLGIATGNTLEAVVGASLVNRYAGGTCAFDRARDVFRFMILAGLVSTALSATCGVTSLALGGFAPWADYGRIWLTWWLGDAGGAAVVAPALILWLGSPRSWVGGRGPEAAALAVVTLLVGAIVFGGFLVPPDRSYALKFLCLPIAIWSAFRFGPRETATIVLCFAGMAVWGTLRGSDSFPSPSDNATLLLLQSFMGVLSVTGMTLAAIVSEQRRTLAAVEQQASELARSNSDLEGFAHVVSHDLKAPLRGIASLATWIADDCRGILPDPSREHLRLLLERAGRMSRLIDGILAYSSAGRAPEVAERIDPKEVLEEVVDFLAPPGGIAVRIEGAFPELRHDRTQLVQVFQNLIGNAVQHLGRPSGTVVVSCRERAGDFEFCVRDDGVGIPEPRLERIFERFEASSTGVGLAIAKKLVELNGGSISVESAVDGGTAFRFTVPKPGRRPSI